MLPIGNLTVFLSVPPSYQYLHSPLTTHISPIHHSPIHSFTHSHFTTHHSPFTTQISPIHHSFIHSFTHSLFHISPIHHSPSTHPPTFLLVFFGKAPFYPKSTRRIIEQHPKESGNEVVKSGQTWSELVKHRQTWSNLVRTGQITQGKCLVFSCVISLGNHSKKI